MKHLTTIALLIVSAITTLAQAPQGSSYQAVVCDANNSIVANADILVTVSILQDSAKGDAVYSETHNTFTNTNDLFTITIDEENQTMFPAIDWSTDVYSLKTDSDYGTSATQIANPSSQSAEKQSQIDLEKSTLKGKFSVSETEQVQFSQGNLQYQASTGTWRFAEHQWDYVGDATSGNVYVGDTKCDNTLISENYDGWIDLFGWGTSGYNDKQPYMSSDKSTDYGPAWSNAKGANNYLTGDNAQYDWGVHNAIENGGSKAGLWRCLTSDEWGYILVMRKNAWDKRGVACVNGVNGLILLPDDWKLPAGLTFNSGTYSSYGRQYYAQKNNYTLAEWSKMESAGAVFLPAAGYRRGGGFYFVVVDDVGAVGGYWMSAPGGASRAQCVYLRSDNVGGNYGNRAHGQPVRVVRTAVE